MVSALHTPIQSSQSHPSHPQASVIALTCRTGQLAAGGLVQGFLPLLALSPPVAAVVVVVVVRLLLRRPLQRVIAQVDLLGALRGRGQGRHRALHGTGIKDRLSRREREGRDTLKRVQTQSILNRSHRWWCHFGSNFKMNKLVSVSHFLLLGLYWLIGTSQAIRKCWLWGVLRGGDFLPKSINVLQLKHERMLWLTLGYTLFNIMHVHICIFSWLTTELEKRSFLCF